MIHLLTNHLLTENDLQLSPSLKICLENKSWIEEKKEHDYKAAMSLC